MDERQNPICSHCGQVIETDDYSFVHGEIVCHECVESDCIRCERCGELIFDEDAYGDDNHTLCRNCYDNFYTRCDNCDCVVHVDDTYNHEDDCLCYDCYQERERYIRDYSYKPEPIFYGKADRYFGVELEIDIGGRDSDNAQSILEIVNSVDDCIYIKSDGSLHDGMEIVTHPMTLDFHRNYHWEDVLNLCHHHIQLVNVGKTFFTCCNSIRL